MTKPTLAFFSTRSRSGIVLKEAFEPRAKELGFDVKIFHDATPIEYANACWNDDVVVLDASIERKGEHNYEIVFPTPLDHLLVVSRTYLPINRPFQKFTSDTVPGFEGDLTRIVAERNPAGLRQFLSAMNYQY